MKRILISAILSVFIISTGMAQVKSKSLSPAPKGSFSVLVMSDTQQYKGKGTKGQANKNSTDEVTNPVFNSQTDWIVKNIKQQNIKFVSHAGDIVDINNEDQWKLARQFMDRLHGVVPYGIVVGNHDMESIGNSALFQEYFPASRYKNFSWYGGFYQGDVQHPEVSGNNANSYQLFSAEGINVIILHLECNAPDSVLQWADKILDQHKDRFAIVTTHMFLGPQERPVKPEDFYNTPKGIMVWSKIHGKLGNTSQQMWDKCFSKHANLQLIFCGDQSRSNAMYLSKVGVHGNVVHALLSDYSANPHGGLRIYRFLPSSNEIQVITYDTTDEKIVEKTKIIPAEKEHNFTIPVKFN